MTIIFLSFFSLSSACLLQEKEPNYSKIVEYCEEVLLVSPVNAKAHHRKGVALYHLTNYEESMSSLLKADQSGKIIICSTTCIGFYDYLICWTYVHAKYLFLNYINNTHDFPFLYSQSLMYCWDPVVCLHCLGFLTISR